VAVRQHASFFLLLLARGKAPILSSRFSDWQPREIFDSCSGAIERLSFLIAISLLP